MDDYWPPERHHVETGYADILFPASLLDVPELAMHAEWHVDDMLGYLRTWSACKRYEQHQERDPVAMIEPLLRKAWGESRRSVSWPLTVRACRPPN